MGEEIELDETTSPMDRKFSDTAMSNIQIKRR